MNEPRTSTTARGDASLRGHHAVVTGGSRGIGAAIAKVLAQRGARVALLARSQDAVIEMAKHVQDSTGSECIGIACDVSHIESIAAAFGEAQGRFGSPSILVNNAGQSEAATFEETTPELWGRMLTVNLTAAFLCTHHVLPAMRTARAGRIINIASTAGLKGYSHTAAYCASKHGLVGLTRALAVETAKLGITVNAVCPGYTDTDMTHTAIENLMRDYGKTNDEARAMLTRKNPRGVLTSPDEVANAVTWLCSPGASAVTGQSIVVAGGEVM